MERGALILILACGLAGCAGPAQERINDYNQDGVHLFRTGDYRAALESFQAAQKLAPEDPALFYNVGQCYDHLGNPALAERNYTECVQRAANHAECRHALVSLLVRTGRRDEAERMVQAWLGREPQKAAAYAEDGWLALQAGDLPRAHARLQQALDLDPHEPRVLIELARIYETTQRPDRAVALYERVLERDPSNPEVIKRLNLLRSQGAGRPQPD